MPNKISVGPQVALFPSPVVMVSCGRIEGPRTITTVAWTGTVCSEPPTVAVALRPSRFSFELVKQYGEFVVNLPKRDNLFALDYCGVVSGRAVDKFEKLNLTPVAGKTVSAPRIAECPVSLECRLKQEVPLGSHHLFIAEVTDVWVDDKVLGPDGKIDVVKASPLCYYRNSYWGLGDSLGRHGFSARE